MDDDRKVLRNVEGKRQEIIEEITLFRAGLFASLQTSCNKFALNASRASSPLTSTHFTDLYNGYRGSIIAPCAVLIVAAEQRTMTIAEQYDSSDNRKNEWGSQQRPEMRSLWM